jgi:hypothetical protein
MQGVYLRNALSSFIMCISAGSRCIAGSHMQGHIATCLPLPLLLLLLLLAQARGGLTKLQGHPWFRHINWNDLKEGRTTVSTDSSVPGHGGGMNMG